MIYKATVIMYIYMVTIVFFANLHKFNLIDVNDFEFKMCKFDTFFYYIPTSANALKKCQRPTFW